MRNPESEGVLLAVQDQVTSALKAVRKMAETMLYTHSVLALRDRAERVRAIINKPDLTTADILRADFGTDCPQGLDVKSYPAIPVNLGLLEKAPHVQAMKFFERRKFLRDVAGTGGDSIDLKKEYLEALASKAYPHDARKRTHAINLLGHETTHVLQYQYPHGNPHFSVRETLAIPVRGGFGGFLQECFRKTMQLKVDFSAWRKSGETVSSYFGSDKEVQARLHEIMATGYAEWKKLPVTRLEFQAALYNAGISPPLSARWRLTMTQEGRAALQEFSCGAAIRKYLASTADDINDVLRHAALPSKRAYAWDEGLPLIYGHLLELYGDSLGRARMGLGSSPVVANEALQRVRSFAPLQAEAAAGLARAMPPDWAVFVFNTLAYMSPLEGNEKIMTQALLAHPETRAAIIDSKDQEKPGHYMLQNSLDLCVARGNGTAVTMLLEAGASAERLIQNFIRLEMAEKRLAAADGDGLSRDFNNKAQRAFFEDFIPRAEKGLAGAVAFFDERGLDAASDRLKPLIVSMRARMAASAIAGTGPSRAAGAGVTVA